METVTATGFSPGTARNMIAPEFLFLGHFGTPLGHVRALALTQRAMHAIEEYDPVCECQVCVAPRRNKAKTARASSQCRQSILQPAFLSGEHCVRPGFSYNRTEFPPPRGLP